MKRFLTAEWRNLVMLNFETDPALLRPLVPAGTELDQWNGLTLISLVGFQFHRTRLLGVPIPFHMNFEEINLRFYVRRQAGDEIRRGVVFVKEIVPRRAIAAVARWIYNENYIAMRMDSRVQVPGFAEYGWGHGASRNYLRAEFSGSPSLPAPGSEEEFIAEHYWGYVRRRRGGTLEYRVEHPPWRVWRADATAVHCDVERCYGSQFCDTLNQQPRSAFIAEGSPITVFRGTRLS